MTEPRWTALKLLLIKQMHYIPVHYPQHSIILRQHDWYPVKLGLTIEKDKEQEYMQCVYPVEPYTSGETVTFGYERVED